MAPQLPIVPGNGVGGRIAALGPGVDPALLGTLVISTTGGTGGYAELVAVDAAGVIGVPEGLGLADAVALLADGRTALSLIRQAAPQVGETVLVEAAAGGVGSLLVQLARNAGARVIGAAGGPRKLALAAELGADVTVDYTAAAWADHLGAEAIDLVFDGVGGTVGRAAFDLVRPGGRFYGFGLASGTFTQIPPAEAAAKNITVLRGGPLSPEAMRELSRAALAEAAAGRLRPVIGQTFPLERAADAHAAMEARATLGKTLLTVR
jgi:NADPH2:quinone reductase